MGKTILSISLMLLLSACGGEYSSDTRRDGTTIDTITSVTTTDVNVPVRSDNAFSQVLPVLQTKCMACHGSSGSFTLGTSSNPLSESDAYNNVMVYVLNANSAADTPLLQKATNSLSSHGGGIQLDSSSAEYIIIESWINTGSSLLGTGTTPTDTNTTTGGTTTPLTTTGSKTFTDVLASLQTKCIVCHGTSGGFTLGSSAVPLTEAEAYNNIMMFTSGTSIAGNTLLLQKATGNAHGGGTVLNTSSPEYLITSKWIESGMSLTESFEMTATTTPPTPVVNPGYDVPTAPIKSFTQNHKDGFSPVQGKACIQCHTAERTDPIAWGGTLFSYIHTPNAKYYQDLSSYKVNIVGENGSSITGTTRSSGSSIGHNNFSSVSGIGSNVAFTAYVKDSNGDVVNQSGTNTHNSSTHLDCNRCHTETGANNAPGRVLVPLVN